jgi:hypothetical protein
MFFSEGDREIKIIHDQVISSSIIIIIIFEYLILIVGLTWNISKTHKRKHGGQLKGSGLGALARKSLP